jgi:hypothetical protein
MKRKKNQKINTILIHPPHPFEYFYVFQQLVSEQGSFSDSLTIGRNIIESMESQDSFPSLSRPPLFNGTNFALWKIRMKTYLMSLGMEIWKIVVDGYKIPTNLPTHEVGKKKYYSDEIYMNSIQGGLT